MIEITLHGPSTILVTGATAGQGAQITKIPGREFIKRGNRWTVPLSRLWDVLRAVGSQNVSIDYAVLVARDEQLQRMIRQYATCGVRIWNDGGKVATDNDCLTVALQPITALLLPFLADSPGPQRAPKPARVITVIDEPQTPPWAGVSLETWLTGVQNAKAAQSKRVNMLRNVRGRGK